MQKLRALLPGSGGGNHQHSTIANNGEVVQRHSIALEPEVGFQITIETSQQAVTQTALQQSSNATTLDAMCQQQKASIPELNVHLLAARHLPNLFGFKIVQGYQIKVKLFPGSKRLDSSIQTNSWPKFNENFRFPLAPDIKPSLKHSSSRGSKPAVSELFTPEELFAGQFVVFTVYALLELPPASFNRFNKTYRSLRDKSSNLVQKVVESSTGKSKDEKENDEIAENGDNKNPKRKSKEQRARESMPALTISESRRNLGSVTCYLEPKLFKRNFRTGLFATEELWLPIKDITTTAKRTKNNDLSNAAKGLIEIILEVRDASKMSSSTDDIDQQTNEQSNGNPFDRIKTALTPPTTPTTPPTPTSATAPGFLNRQNSNNSNISNNNNNNIGARNISNNKTNSFVCRSQQWATDVRQKIASKSTTSISSANGTSTSTSTNTNTNMGNNNKSQQWNRMTAEVKRKMGMSNVSKSALHQNDLVLRITTARMRCNQKVKDELEFTAGSVYVKTAVFEHGVFVDSWKSANFYPSLSTKWNVSEEIATLSIPLHSLESLQHLLIRTTLATKTKLGKKLVLGTVLIGAKTPPIGGNEAGVVHMQQMQEFPVNQPVPMWHCYQ